MKGRIDISELNFQSIGQKTQAKNYIRPIPDLIFENPMPPLELIGDNHAITPAALGSVKGRLCRTEQIFDGLAVVWKDRQPD